MAPVRKLFFLLLAFLPVGLRAQVITTVAGCGIPGYLGDGGPATAAYIRYPYCVAVDRRGFIYFSEFDNSTIRRVDTAGVITTYAGIGTMMAGYSGDHGPATAAQLFTPAGMAFDRIGNLYFSDLGNQTIRKIDTAGIITTIAGTGVVGYNGDSMAATIAQLNFPTGVAVDSIGNVYIADQLNYRVRKVSISGVITTIAGIGVAGYSGNGIAAIAAQLRPVGLAIDRYGNIYLTDTALYVRQINGAGIITTIAGNGSGIYSGDGGPATAAGLMGVANLTIDDTGNIYLPDVYSRVRKISPAGIITRIAGTATPGYSGDGGDPLLAQLYSPTGIGLGKNGKIYIADPGLQRVRCIGCKAPTEIEGVTKGAVSLFVSPNPVINNKCTFTLASPYNCQAAVKIINPLGKVVQQLQCSTNAPVPVAIAAPPGIYYVQAITPYGVYTEQLVVAAEGD